MARSLSLLLGLLATTTSLAGCVIRPSTQLALQDAASAVVVQRPAVVLQQPVIVRQPAPVVIRPAPVVVRQPVVVRRPAPVMTPVRVSVPAQLRPTSASGVISVPYQRLRYPLHVHATRTLTIDVHGHGLDPTVALYSANGARIGFDDDGGVGLDSRLVVTLAPGRYTIEVAGWSSSTGSFTLSIR